MIIRPGKSGASRVTTIEDKLRELLRQQAEEIEGLRENGRHRSESYDQLNQRLQAAERERDEWKREALLQARLYLEKQTALHTSQQHNTALRECLAWYADERIYEPHRMIGGAKYGMSDAEQDDGRRASTLLAELDRKDTQPATMHLHMDSGLHIKRLVEDTQGEGGHETSE